MNQCLVKGKVSIFFKPLPFLRTPNSSDLFSRTDLIFLIFSPVFMIYEEVRKNFI